MIPKNLFDYNLSKIQNALLETLPLDERKPFLELQLAGKLVGPALEALKNQVKARETGTLPGKAAKESKAKQQEIRVKMTGVARGRIKKMMTAAKSVGDHHGTAASGSAGLERPQQQQQRRRVPLGSMGKDKPSDNRGGHCVHEILFITDKLLFITINLLFTINLLLLLLITDILYIQ